VNLPASAAGQNVRFRWRLGSDSSISSIGWYVDTVALYDAFTCCNGIPGDMDGDGDVDQTDFGLLQVCLSGPNVPQTNPSCTLARLDPDSDVDHDDAQILRGCTSGPEVPGNPLCRP
jgi:hypothetical protein